MIISGCKGWLLGNFRAIFDAASMISFVQIIAYVVLIMLTFF